MLGIRIMAKLGSITCWIKFEDKFEDKKKARPKSITRQNSL